MDKDVAIVVGSMGLLLGPRAAKPKAEKTMVPDLIERMEALPSMLSPDATDRDQQNYSDATATLAEAVAELRSKEATVRECAEICVKLGEELHDESGNFDPETGSHELSRCKIYISEAYDRCAAAILASFG